MANGSRFSGISGYRKSAIHMGTLFQSSRDWPCARQQSLPVATRPSPPAPLHSSNQHVRVTLSQVTVSTKKLGPSPAVSPPSRVPESDPYTLVICDLRRVSLCAVYHRAIQASRTQGQLTPRFLSLIALTTSSTGASRLD